MKSRFRIRPIDGMVLLAIAVYAGFKGSHRSVKPDEVPSVFAGKVDLSPLDRIAVHADGRLRSFESHAKTYVGFITGPRTIRGQTNGFTYLDLIFRPEEYQDVDLIYVKNKNVRSQILSVLRDHPDVTTDRAAGILADGLFSRRLLNQPQVVELLQRLGQDLIRTEKAVNAIQQGMGVSDPRFLLDALRLLAPPDGNPNSPWVSIAQLAAETNAPADAIHANLGAARSVPGLDPAIQKLIGDAWNELRRAWRDQDAAAVHAQLAKVAALLPTISPRLYPEPGRLSMESWYFRTGSMTWVWLFYLAGVVPLLMSVIYRWDGARKVGMALFVIAFGFHTASLGIRWYISGRWPNANMFEAVTTSAWFGGVAAVVLECVARRSVFRNLFALGASVGSMAALMAAYFLPANLDSSINNKMAALNDIWLYIHTNVIIWSYAVIGLACLPALLQLRHRWCLAWDETSIPRIRLLILPIALTVLNYTAYRLLMHLMDDPARVLHGSALIGTAGAFWGSSLIVLLELLGVKARREAGAAVERSAGGGAASLILGSPAGPSFLKPGRPTMSQVFDGATMVLVELSFIMLWTGITMGAIWADHSWGRPWGWDPKEVFALNTFLIFLILIHVRLKVRDKAFWTAVLAVVGFEVMMFNWIVVNFVISGLHSYA